MALAPPVLCHTVPMAPEHRHVAATVRDGARQCPLCGVERTLSECIATSQFDRPICDIQPDRLSVLNSVTDHLAHRLVRSDQNGLAVIKVQHDIQSN